MQTDKRIVLAAATALGTQAGSIERELPPLPEEDQILFALKRGHDIGRALMVMSPEELSAFRLGLLAAAEAPYTP